MYSESDEILRRIDALYARREMNANVNESISLLRSLNRPGSFEVHWRLSRAYFFLGQEARDRSEVRRSHREGVASGRIAARATPSRVEGHFWLGVNLALAAAAVPKWQALVPAGRAQRALQRGIDIDPAYHGAGPHRVMARLLQHLPRLLGGGVETARRHFEAAVALSPNNTVTRIYFAEFLRGIGQPDLAHEQLRAVISAPPDPLWEFEIARDRAIARSLLDDRN